jgi:hypothetical protein
MGRLSILLVSIFLFFSLILPLNLAARADSFRIPAGQLLQESAQFNRLQPRISIGGLGNLLYHEGLYRSHLILKFSNFIPVRLRNTLPAEVDSRIPDDLQRVPMQPRIGSFSIKQLRYVPQLQIARERKLMRQANISTDLIVDEINLINQLLSGSAIRRLEPLFSRSDEDLNSERRTIENLSGIEAADLSNYYHIELAENANPSSILGQLNSLKIVETAYYAPIPEPADIPPATNNFEGNQGYLNAAPNGIDARFAWTIPGGRGADVRIFDIEAGWEQEHEDLDNGFFVNGVNNPLLDSRNHGTAVLGEMVALDNGSGVTGIVPQSNFGAVSVIRVPRTIEFRFVADAISTATGILQPGDIILIEQHARGPGNDVGCTCNCDQFRFVPMEFWQAEFDAIQIATSRGLIVVEAAGNGGQNLDNPIYGNRFQRNTRDSRAILVGGGGSGETPSRVPMCWTNFGSRLDLQGWGEGVQTLGYGIIRANGSDRRQWYTDRFSGTSSASPIVTGAVAVIQGLQKAAGRSPLGANDVRRLLVNTGTPQAFTAATTGRQIGPLPNLRAAIQQLNIAPINYGECSAVAASSSECGGAACVRKPAAFVEGECFLGIFCEDSYWVFHTDEFQCVNR